MKNKDAEKIYSWGKALNELHDNPHFEAYQDMLETIMQNLQNTICSDSPEMAHDLCYPDILVHRAGQVYNMKKIFEIQEQYRNNYLNSPNKEEIDDTEHSSSGTKSKSGTTAADRAAKKRVRK